MMELNVIVEQSRAKRRPNFFALPLDELKSSGLYHSDLVSTPAGLPRSVDSSCQDKNTRLLPESANESRPRSSRLSLMLEKTDQERVYGHERTVSIKRGTGYRSEFAELSMKRETNI